MIAAAVFWVPYSQYLTINPAGDFRVHITYAQNLAAGLPVLSPHFGFQYATIVMAWLTGFSYDAAGVLVVAACYGWLALLLRAELRRRSIHLGKWFAGTVILCLLISSQVSLFTAWIPNLYYGYFAPIVYHNPTQQLMKASALFIWFLFVRLFLVNRSSRSSGAASYVLLGAACVVSAICKPSFLIAFLPVAGLRALLDLANRKWARARAAAGAIAVPSALVLSWQFWFAYRTATPAGISFVPLAIFSDPVALLWKGSFSILLPLAVIIAVGGRERLPAQLLFAWLLLLVALAYTLLLVETGPRMMEGNFAWSAQIGVFILYVESILFTLQHWNKLSQAGRIAIVASISMHVLSGCILYGAASLFPGGLWV